MSGQEGLPRMMEPADSLNALKQSLQLRCDQFASEKSTESFSNLHQDLQNLLGNASSSLESLVQAGEAPTGEIRGLNDSVSAARKTIQARCELLQEAVDDARAMVEDAGEYQIDTSTQGVEDIIKLSHKLAYSSFAPLTGMDLVTEYRVCMPPFPTNFHFQLSFLNQFAHRRAAQQQEDAAAARAAKAQQQAAKMQDETVNTGPPQAAMSIPAMPPGWKPGDPIPLPPEIQAALATAQVAPAPAAPDLPPGPPAAMDLDLDAGIDDDFILNAEAVEESDEDSSEGDSEEGDEDEAMDSD